MTKQVTGKAYSLEKITAWSYDEEGHAEKCVERLCDLAQTTPCIDDHQILPGDYETTGKILCGMCPDRFEMLVFVKMVR